eukprot:CCRYP_002712-RA/>CCRYP_002712-RA protein AED:0.46 eAED:0.46 QI:0/0/0/1/0/0/2/0/92
MSNTTAAHLNATQLADFTQLHKIIQPTSTNKSQNHPAQRHKSPVYQFHSTAPTLYTQITCCPLSKGDHQSTTNEQNSISKGDTTHSTSIQHP